MGTVMGRLLLPDTYLYRVQGDAGLTSPFFDTVSIIA